MHKPIVDLRVLFVVNCLSHIEYDMKKMTMFQTPSSMHLFRFLHHWLSLDEAVASTALIVIVFGSDGRDKMLWSHDSCRSVNYEQCEL